MRQLSLTHSGAPLSLQVLNALQNELGVKFPDSFKSFLLVQNGGNTPRLSKDSKYFIRDFLIAGGEANDSLQAVFYGISEVFNNSKYWLPFGADSGDWIYCICLKPELYGKIYLMRTDEIEEDDAFDFVCNSFGEFLEGVKF